MLILDPDQGTLIVRGHRGYRDDVLGLEIEIGEGVSGRCAATGEVQVVDDVSEDPDYIPGLPDAASEVAVPLIHQGEVIGVLNAESEQEDAFDEAARRLLSVVGRQVATVLAATRLQEENRRLAVTDGLTGLHNRRYFERRLAEAVERAERYGERLALVYIDLDRFKAVNDSHGHPVGDLVLRRTAGALEDRCRGSDLLARIGGEEFAVLLFRVGRSKARGIADRLRRAIEALEIDAEGVEEPLTITVSAGVALYPDHGPGLEELHRTADMALYRSKEAGRNRVTVYD